MDIFQERVEQDLAQLHMRTKQNRNLMMESILDCLVIPQLNSVRF